MALSAVSCVGNGLPPSIWPPENFRLVVEELNIEGGFAHVVRRFQVDATGLVIYGTSSRPLVGSKPPQTWPVFDRLAIYRLESKCVRGLARRLARLGIDEITASASPGADGIGQHIQWQAFGSHPTELQSSGRLRGPIAEVMAEVAAHLPPGEAFEVQLNRPIEPVLHGVPAPAESAEGALAAYTELLRSNPDDEDLLLAAYALACAVGDRAQAVRWLEQWREVQRSLPPEAGFRDDPSDSREAHSKALEGFLPAA
jgi:hypothetical protein